MTVAASIINSIDFDTNPCDNFYQYACGGWIKKNPIPDGKSMWGTFGKLEQQNQLVVKNVLGNVSREKYYFKLMKFTSSQQIEILVVYDP